jgi:transcriptional antiterminator RfaH
MSYWAVAQTEPQREHTARLLLMRANYETYAPRIKQRGRIALLFPTYLFVRVIDRWYPILWTIGVTRMLMSGERPARLPDEIIPSLRKRERGGLIKLPPPGRALKAGQNVKIIRGSFEGHLALYEGQSGRDRERVLLELLGQLVSIELPSADIAPAMQKVAS